MPCAPSSLPDVEDGRAHDAACVHCPRLARHLAGLRRSEPGWFNAPVATRGPSGARLLVVGLAPGRQGANRTGIPFFGDDSGSFLLPALARAGFLIDAGARGYRLRGARITNAVRCLPPENRPTGEEINRCRPHLERELGLLLRGGRRRRPVVVLALGRVAHDSIRRTLGFPAAQAPFGHGAQRRIGERGHLVASFHPSRYNVHTGRITAAMFDEVLARVVELLA